MPNIIALNKFSSFFFFFSHIGHISFIVQQLKRLRDGSKADLQMSIGEKMEIDAENQNRHQSNRAELKAVPLNPHTSPGTSSVQKFI